MQSKRRRASALRISGLSALLLTACQAPRPPAVDLDALHTEPPAAGTGSCPALAADWLARLPAHQRRVAPADCSSHPLTPLFSWSEARERQTGASYTLSVRRSGGGSLVASRSGLTEPRARLAAALPAGSYEWSVSTRSSSGATLASEWRRFSIEAQARAMAGDLPLLAPSELPDGASLAALAGAKARPRMLPAGASFSALRSSAGQGEHLPVFTLLRARAAAAQTAALPANPDSANPRPGAAQLASLARGERQQLEALALVARLDANAAQLAQAKARLLALAAWNPAGASGEAAAPAANRELGLALAQGLDLLWNELSGTERSLLGSALRSRALAASAALTQLDREPYDPAALDGLRQLTQTLMLASGAPGFAEAPTLLARHWEQTLHALDTWGDDGSAGGAIAAAWQQFASQTVLAAATRAISGVNLYQLASLRRAGEALLAFSPPGASLPVAFGDGLENRSLYDQHAAALRLHALQSREARDAWYWQAKPAHLSSPPDASAWQLLLLGLPGATSPLASPSASLANDWFSSQAGLAALHSDIRRADRSSLYFRSGPQGAHGAAQADQNAIAYVSQGQPLLVNAGYSPSEASAHRKATRATRYKNALTVDGGLGQAEPQAGATRPGDPLASMDAAGSLIRTQSSGNYAAATGDASAAYRAWDSARGAWVPLLSNAVRSVVTDKANGLTLIYDWATSATPRQWELNFHSPNAFAADAATVRASNAGASVCIDRYGAPTQFTQTMAWDVPPEIPQPAQAHARLTTLARSAEFVHLTVLREACRSLPLQVAQNGSVLAVNLPGQGVVQFDRRAFSLPSNAANANAGSAAPSVVPVIAMATGSSGTLSGSASPAPTTASLGTSAGSVATAAAPAGSGASFIRAAQLAPVAASEANYQAIIDRLRTTYLAISTWQADEALRTIQPNGEWTDVAYGDRSAGSWLAIPHLERTRALAIAYQKPGHKLRGSPAAKSAVVNALRAWLRRAPSADSWWQNTIGQQLALMPTLVLMQGELPTDLRDGLIALLTPMQSVPLDRFTGQNLVWYATQSIVRGALTRNAIELQAAREAVRSTLAVTTAEGIQADFSFHQHENQLYTGGYGLMFLVDTTQVMEWLQGTPFAYPEESLQLAANVAMQGVLPLVRMDWLDWGARGRELTRQDAIARPQIALPVFQRLAKLLPARSAELNAAAMRIRDRTVPSQVQSRAYWRSDFVAHQSPQGYFSVKMSSRRTVGTESGNGENVLGYWLPFGTTFVVQTGAEYIGLQPLLDWSSLPGTTAPATVPAFTGYLRHAEDRVAVLSEGGSSLATMQMNTQGTQAKKFWFLSGNLMVALGSDLQSTSSLPVRTTVNQMRYAGSAQSSVGSIAQADAAQSGVRWLVHGGVGYRLLDGQTARWTVQSRSLQGPDPTNAQLGAKGGVPSTRIGTLQIEHGLRPSAASYAYAVQHGVSSASDLANTPTPTVLHNSAELQAAAAADGSVMAAVFHRAGRLKIDSDLSLEVDRPCALIARRTASGLQVHLVDLLPAGGPLTLRSLRGASTLDAKTIALPALNARTVASPHASVALRL